MRNDRGISGTLYGVGVGPGDPGLLTIKGRDILLQVDTVFVPAPAEDRPSLAMSIVQRAGLRECNFQKLVFPMTRDEKILKAAWDTAARRVDEVLSTGRDAAFITLGDPLVYSTFSYLAAALRRCREEARIEAIPGITTMSLAAALVGQPLLEGDERLCLLPLPEDLGEIRVLAQSFDTLVFYKVGDRLEEAVAAITDLGLADSTSFASRAGLPEQILAPRLGEIPPDAAGYLSVLITRTGRGE